MAIAGLRGTGDWGPDERPKSFRETILMRQPNGTAPVFALTSKAKKRVVDDPEFAWWDEVNDIVRLTVNGALGTGDSTIAVDSLDPTDTNPTAFYGKADHLKPGDLLLVEPGTDAATFNHELLEVTEVMSSSQFTVKRGVGGTTAAVIPDNAGLTLIGSAYAEGSAAPRAVSRNPVKYKNYIQIFKDTYELTGTADNTHTRTGSAWSNDKKRKLFDHAQKIEWSILMGRKHETTGSNGKPLRFMGGIREVLPSSNVTVFGAAVTISTLYDALGPIFDYDTGAGDQRIAFAGHQALMELQKVFGTDSSVRRDLGPKMTVFGMNLTELIMPHGTVFIRTHPLLSRHPLYKKSMFVLDFDSINYVSMKNRDTKIHDDVQAKDEDVRRGFIQTDASLEVARGGVTMAYLGNVSAT